MTRYQGSSAESETMDVPKARTCALFFSVGGVIGDEPKNLLAEGSNFSIRGLGSSFATGRRCAISGGKMHRRLTREHGVPSFSLVLAIKFSYFFTDTWTVEGDEHDETVNSEVVQTVWFAVGRDHQRVFAARMRQVVVPNDEVSLVEGYFHFLVVGEHFIKERVKRFGFLWDDFVGMSKSSTVSIGHILANTLRAMETRETEKATTSSGTIVKT